MMAWVRTIKGWAIVAAIGAALVSGTASAQTAPAAGKRAHPTHSAGKKPHPPRIKKKPRPAPRPAAKLPKKKPQHAKAAKPPRKPVVLTGKPGGTPPPANSHQPPGTSAPIPPMEKLAPPPS
ncbi:MAG: hypothetical protein HY898_13075 [Deltaproteobacteria bacterium]|nr:hypothetical protein [Deltaproteobacteria bacterium]